jgi:hypothetical protein
MDGFMLLGEIIEVSEVGLHRDGVSMDFLYLVGQKGY